MTQPASPPVPTNPVFVGWLNSLNACAPAIDFFMPAVNYQTAYAALGNPEWLLWISLRQAPDVKEIERIVGALVGYMEADILAAITDAPSTTVVTAALAIVTAFGAGNPPPDIRQLMPTQNSVERTAVAVPLTSDNAGIARSYAVSAASRLVQLCMMSDPVEAARTGGQLGLAWQGLELALGRVTKNGVGLAVCHGLRTVLPFKGDYAPTGA